MIVTFKKNYDVRISEEDNFQSGVFTFMCGKSYESEYRGNYLYIWDKNKKITLMFNKFDEERYLV